jgi:di/tripeptidase
MNQHQHLSRFEAARFALAEARRVDEVKEIRDKALALAEYARQAKDTELLSHATEIRLRAERRAEELLAEMAERGERAGSGSADGSGRTPSVPTLENLGVTKTQSSKWQKLAVLPDDKFELRVEHAKARVEGMTTSAPSYPKAEYHGENEWFTPADWVARAPGARRNRPRSRLWQNVKIT